MVKGLPANAGIGERAADRQVEVVGPRLGREAAVGQRPVQHIDPEITPPDVDIVLARGRRVRRHRSGRDPAAAHLDHDAARGERLAVAVGRADEARDVARATRAHDSQWLGPGDASEVDSRRGDLPGVQAKLALPGGPEKHLGGLHRGSDGGRQPAYDEEQQQHGVRHASKESVWMLTWGRPYQREAGEDRGGSQGSKVERRRKGLGKAGTYIRKQEKRGRGQNPVAVRGDGGNVS
ncbi:hypothetical protein BHM03_00045000 [Ensete ventricosum]|nr:hypothetical protein BHM03_00045000 [Ensete ventricosum]